MDQMNHAPDEELLSLTYEQALAALEAVVAKLESGDVTLDESMQLFRKGTLLSRICADRLAAIERQITQLLEKEDGSVEEKPFAND
ncbi:MAG: exodeoxyribonuclease VII small subunit [Eubacteriales bacterium]|nr:exodeoxyribonuclease VII small subunit [Clostridiales bacterium]MDD2440907.1 exodeoxyribonuclease VII small subunit [Eubacteriales bacterium]MDD4138645.1 exodeoxyribonuclease VII small subunit [Eubacteriales bacterium]MDD4743521.1 exodeoxyribonuclease VII small subunit [Eubacteriales bacterium]